VGNLKKNKKAEELLFELAMFLAMSARTVEEEKIGLGSIRLISALSKLIELSEVTSSLEKNDFLLTIKSKLDRGESAFLEDRSAYVMCLNNLAKDFMEEAKKRY